MKLFIILCILCSCFIGCTSEKKQPLPALEMPYNAQFLPKEMQINEPYNTPEEQWNYAYNISQLYYKKALLYTQKVENFLLSFLPESVPSHLVLQRCQQAVENNELIKVIIEKDRLDNMKEIWQDLEQADLYWLYCGIWTAHIRQNWLDNLEETDFINQYSQKIQNLPLMSEIELARKKITVFQNIYLQFTVHNDFDMIE